MASTLGELHVLCTCGRPLRIPTEIVTVQTDDSRVIARIDVDRGYLYAHMHTWHQPNGGGEPLPALDLLSAA